MTEEKLVYGEEVCCHCGGLGCRYCDGKGTVQVVQPAKKCRHCHGECCIYCGYTGWEGVKGKYE